ncbi:hypothetical protein [Ligilactobacillus murinus]|jgi:hypothetical protein|uniref:Uncharacterized protein n=2 Tax=Ligilactobacillus murinus TaxID=1622 RepID=A0A4Q2AZ32_9LACO|nr:hypothetical protein [Ligilactobacillus murinus]NBH85486.1 hypothetical protein [Lachnospiraceae bacterium]MBF0701085.1 hypothetical protein [Ligilactobacillus murinus]MCR1881132.1 hypothetical protein [Ligilactobacillus murinus]MCZ0674255.1 hypothetical protein [Ligilactobacillus murinus]MCZ0695220.1 hypothetical protein [Ligilactobacillus murinus]
MNILGISLYIFWLLLVILKFSSLPHDRRFSYQQAFFGTLYWYKNFRNLLLLCALMVLFIFAPLKLIYFLFFITACLIFLMTARNFWFRIGNAWTSIYLCLACILIGIGTGLFVFRT